MSGFLLAYGVLRNAVLKHRKELCFLIILCLAAFLCYSYANEGKVGKLRTVNADYEGPGLIESLSFLGNFDQENLERLSIGEAAPNPLDAEKAVESLIKMEEECLKKEREAVNGSSLLDSKPVFDSEGNEIGLRFLVVSDWGGKPKPPYTTSAQMKVGRGMAALAERYDSSFVISLGDNFCDEGVKNVDDMRFEDTFEDVFTQASLQMPWYVVAGDVDYRGNVSAQIEYTKRSERWRFPKNYYKTTTELATFKNITVDFLFIDTVQLCGRLPTSGRIQPTGPDNVGEAEAQWTWINEELKASKAEYLIVAGHYPVFSGGIHGSTKCLADRLRPLLKEYHASAYFSGHDHSMQHIKSASKSGVHYFVSGASSDHDDRPDHLDGIFESTRYFWTNHLDKTTGAFTYCDVRKDQMTVTFVHSDESVLYTTDILPRSHPDNKLPEKDVIIKAVKVPEMKKPPKIKKAHGLPDLQHFRPKSKSELRTSEQNFEKKQQEQVVMSKQKQQQQLQKQKQMKRPSKKMQQKLLQQHQLHVQHNANKMGQRYRGP